MQVAESGFGPERGEQSNKRQRNAPGHVRVTGEPERGDRVVRGEAYMTDALQRVASAATIRCDASLHQVVAEGVVGRLAYIIIGLLVGAGIVLAVAIARDRDDAPPIVIRDPLAGANVTIDVSGAVVAPGVYVLPADARAMDAITAAGGPLADADLAGLNRAARLRDGQALVVPSLAPSPLAAGGLIDLNTANQAGLETLPGIGPAKAAAIIAWREANDGFASIDELRLVDGISDNLVEELRPLVTVTT